MNKFFNKLNIEVSISLIPMNKQSDFLDSKIRGK
jgi:hypothetical protein